MKTEMSMKMESKMKTRNSSMSLAALTLFTLLFQALPAQAQNSQVGSQGDPRSRPDRFVNGVMKTMIGSGMQIPLVLNVVNSSGKPVQHPSLKSFEEVVFFEQAKKERDAVQAFEDLHRSLGQKGLILDRPQDLSKLSEGEITRLRNRWRSSYVGYAERELRQRPNYASMIETEVLQLESRLASIHRERLALEETMASYFQAAKGHSDTKGLLARVNRVLRESGSRWRVIGSVSSVAIGMAGWCLIYTGVSEAWESVQGSADPHRSTRLPQADRE